MDEVYGPRSAMISAQAWEIGKLKAEVFRLQTALAAATERAEAAEARLDKDCGCWWGPDEDLNHCEYHAEQSGRDEARVSRAKAREQTAKRERDAAIARAEAAEGYIARIEAIRGKKLGVPCCCDFADDDTETPIVECDYHRAVREERDAANARADALAARLRGI